jgi:predicted nucleic acid-binding protein
MVLTDTGFWVALINKRDRHHARAVSYMASCKERQVTTWPVITETCHLLGRDVGVESQILFLQMLKSGLVEIAGISTAQIDRLNTLMKKYADLPMDLADASMVLLAEELGHGRILSTDQRDFNCYRWKNRQPFENLLLADN